MNSKDSTENGSIETPIKNYDGFKKEIEGEGNSSKKGMYIPIQPKF